MISSEWMLNMIIIWHKIGLAFGVVSLFAFAVYLVIKAVHRRLNQNEKEERE